jgi:hypothetical protein
MKDRVYSNKANSLDEFETEIREAFNEIDAPMLRKMWVEL